MAQLAVNHRDASINGICHAWRGLVGASIFGFGLVRQIGDAAADVHPLNMAEIIDLEEVGHFTPHDYLNCLKSSVSFFYRRNTAIIGVILQPPSSDTTCLIFSVVGRGFYKPEDYGACLSAAAINASLQVDSERVFLMLCGEICPRLVFIVTQTKLLGDR
ncbi:MAG: hypothetical protein AAF414_04415 [Pseudomonadota bacterium]